MASITTDTFLDGGTARTAGESWGFTTSCTLTVRTDTRWHADAPAGMTGTLGTINLSFASKFKVDGTKVRWMAFNTGSGTVPAIGTTITQGSVSGYLLGVWADYVSAPTAVGASMPASGYLKFREVTGGTFAAGALSGISANASSADVTGWIEVVRDIGSGCISVAQSSIEMFGDWFYLGNTNGVRGQTFQVPTNAGGNDTSVCAVQVETSPGSGIFEWWGGVSLSNFTVAAWAQDQRSKVFLNANNGVIKFGNNGTADTAHVPVSGCKVRIPNIFYRQCNTTSRNLNALPSANINSRPSIVAADCKSVILDKVITDLGCQLLLTAGGSITNSAVDGLIRVENNTNSIVIDNCGISSVVAYLQPRLIFDNCVDLSVMNNHVLCQQTTAVRGGTTTIKNSVFDNNKFVHFRPTDGAAGGVSDFYYYEDCEIKNNKFIGGTVQIRYCKNVTIENNDYIHRTGGDSNSTTSTDLFSLTGNDDIVIDGLTFGFNGQITNCCNYGPIINNSNNIGPQKIRNIGSYNSPLIVHSNNTYAPSYLFYPSTMSKDTTFQRCYLSYTRLGLYYQGAFSSSNIVFENCSTGYSSTATGILKLKDSLLKGIGGGLFNNWAITTEQTNCHFGDGFTSATQGVLRFAPGRPLSALSANVITYNVGSTNLAAGPAGLNFNLFHANDTITIETPYWVKGHTAFSNQTPYHDSIGNEANQDIHYDLNTGNGYSGVWKLLTVANLITESISPTGFKMKVRYTAKTTTTNTVVGTSFVYTTSTAAAQAANLYPLDTNTLTLTGLVAGSEVRCYQGTDPATAVEIGGTESSGTSFSFTHNSGGQVGYIRVFALGYQPVNYDPYTFPAADTSILVQQTVDRNYNNS